jgi:hypothetical protein
MSRTLLVIVLAAACGGGAKKSTVPPPQLPPEEAKTEPAKPPEEAKPAEEQEPAERPAPTGPLDAAINAPKLTVKLVSAGKGKKTALKLSPKQGAKQQVEIALDFAEKQSAPDMAGGDTSNVVPTVVLQGESEVKSVDPAGKAEYAFTVKTTDVRPKGDPVPAEKLERFKSAVGSLQGLVMGGTIDANAMASDIKLHIDQQRAETQAAIELIQVAMPVMPALPAEPIGVGAKWTVTRPMKLLDKVDVTQTTDYELVDHKGTTWTIKGTTKVTGADQEMGVGDAKLSKIAGTGAVEASLIDGALYPTLKSNTDTSFQITVTGPDPADPTQKKVATLTIQLTQAAQLTAK